MPAIGFADAAFEQVPLYRALETALGHGNQYAGRLLVAALQKAVTETTLDTSLSLPEKCLHSFLATEPLRLGEGFIRHDLRLSR